MQRSWLSLSHILLAFVLCLASTFVFAQPKVLQKSLIPVEDYATAETIPNIVKNPEVQNLLKAKLGAHYEDFIQNFVHVPKNYIYRDGALAVWGYKEFKNGDIVKRGEGSAAFTITPDGKIHAAYILSGANRIIYFPAKKGNYLMHPAILGWFEVVGDGLPIISEDNVPMQQTLHLEYFLEDAKIEKQFFQSETLLFQTYSWNSISQDEISAYRKIILSIWGTYGLNQISINRYVADSLDKIVEELQFCRNLLGHPLPAPNLTKPTHLSDYPAWGELVANYINIIKNQSFNCFGAVVARHKADVFYYGLPY